MQKEAFKLLHDSESSWWYRGRALAVKSVLDRFLCKGETILDFGAGFGGMRNLLSAYGEVSAFEPEPEARAIAKTRGYKRDFDSAEDFFSQSEKFSGTAIFDVLEHMDNDSNFLLRIKNNIKDKGFLIITVPAHKWLWGKHDETHYHKRRYSEGEIKKLLERTGFSAEYVSYWNALLLLPAVIVRFLGGTGESSFSMPKILDAIFFAVLYIESKILRFSKLPFGMSLVIFARKK